MIEIGGGEEEERGVEFDDNIGLVLNSLRFLNQIDRIFDSLTR